MPVSLLPRRVHRICQRAGPTSRYRPARFYEAHEFFESKSADFAPVQEGEQHISPQALRLSGG
ncbi:unnamed protein product [Penicillium camemberti]|uniref:Str. FM013 n=1 Tax=Penicillium camemberti (strain FM 013) TaxID=1429867 RepID=A0A0G4PJ85_PENC3|nr:unnamed protein product [Penicillium camemberti]